MIAHVEHQTGRIQSLCEHSKNVSYLCQSLTHSFPLKNTASLIGLLHDMGKGTQLFQSYLLKSSGLMSGNVIRGTVHHAPVGAIFAYRRWYHPDASIEERIAAQLLMLTIYGHHTGMMDVLTPDGQLRLLKSMEQDTDVLCYDEAVNNYFREVYSPDELDVLFSEAVTEVRDSLEQLKASGITDKPFIRSLLARELLGILVDADRWDSSCFEFEKNPREKSVQPNWTSALDSLHTYLANMDRSTHINQLRSMLSEECEKAASGSGRLFRLSVPTGGGKTFASLRFALKHAQTHAPGIERVFYIIPFNTILDQNARDIREALGGTLRILEHHSNVVFTGEEADEEYENHRLLTERWDSDLILTSMVQFLNCFYTASNTDARRLPHLSGSVLIFDEIQALPKNCIRLFELAVDFLTEFCGCTVVLCTATQPALHFHLPAVELVPDVSDLFIKLKRTQLIDETKIALSYCEAAERATKLMDRYGAVLMIVNTKDAAREMADLMKENGFPTVHLSTDMIPAHRIRVIESIRHRDHGKPLFCVSTALIEAGINISFPCVIRSLAGLGSILQAAGRCNRNGELGAGLLGDVYIWQLKEERLQNLSEIAAAQQVARGILASDFIPDSPEGIDQYFINERDEFKRLEEYPVADPKARLTDLFGGNTVSRKEIHGKDPASFPIPAAFHTVGAKFQVIDSQTRSVLVPYEKGEEIISKLCASQDMSETVSLLRDAQQYSVSLYENRFAVFCRDGRIRYEENSGVYILMKAYYSHETGVTDVPVAIDDLYI